MDKKILGIVGIIVMIYGIVMLIRNMAFRAGAAQTLGKVVSSRPDDKGRYIHTLTYEVEGERYSAEDSAGYSQPLPAGAERLLLTNRKDPKKFRFRDELRTSNMAFGGCVVMGMLFILRFMLF